MTPDANDLCVFAVKRGYIESKEIYCNPLYPTYLSLVEKYQHSPYANGILNNHVAVNPKTDCSLLSDSSEVSFVPMANVQEKTNVVSYDMVAYETVKNYLIPFCIIVFPDNVSMKDEKIIFHNINSKAVPIRSERLLEGIIVDSKDELSFSDKELDDSFGHEYLLARKVLKNKPLAIRKLKAIPWIRSDLITALIDIIESIQKRFGNIQTAEHEEAFGIALSNALNDAKLGENGTLLISSGLLFLLVALYYNIEISSPSADAVQYKDTSSFRAGYGTVIS